MILNALIHAQEENLKMHYLELVMIAKIDVQVVLMRLIVILALRIEFLNNVFVLNIPMILMASIKPVLYVLLFQLDVLHAVQRNVLHAQPLNIFNQTKINNVIHAQIQ
ncbi:hypothetical protein IMG5_000240 [Ichthyophthirius multifiliis]|uniref:Uncharacterized protein n=1 Tax=Ichthyophthirius multifiliis TaxID=5932 RepID=G0QIP3_ICHMU|nr:hypothetical protein IMG5_000240 [Ichthyophthirius multifiliis]EGR34913.1 hypothetical protein IMG5_000240 [Ichthyophthirius multifiliis]|eukprot:XP_004040217.1 hypothetical protein IMG5_000240 [Ichthyophthirius multifiliis]